MPSVPPAARWRRTHKEDLPVLAALLAHPRVAPLMGWPTDADAVARSIAGLVPNYPGVDARYYAVVLGARERVVGLVTLDWSRPEAEIAFALAPRWWRKGIMSGLLPGLLRAELPWGIERVSATAAKGNHASAGLLGRLGFHPVNTTGDLTRWQLPVTVLGAQIAEAGGTDLRVLGRVRARGARAFGC